MGDKEIAKKLSNKARKAIEAMTDETVKSCKIIITKDKNGRIAESFIQKKEDL